MEETQERRALVLSGGGGRGAYQVGVLTYLEEAGWEPDMIVGTSIGAVNGAALTSGLTVAELRERWLDMETSDFQYMRADDVFVDNLFRQRTHVFDNEPLLEMLMGTSPKWEERAWMSPFVINGPDALYDLWVTAVDLAERRLVYFHNRNGQHVTPQMVQASCSIPLWCAPTVIEGRPYLDGGTLSNTPFRKALDEGATEIVVVMLKPWQGGEVRSWEMPWPLPPINDELLKIPQALWDAFSPALDMMLNQITWQEYQLFLSEVRRGEHAQLKWLRFVAPRTTIGSMTIYERSNHERLFRLGERDAREDLEDLLEPQPDARAGRSARGWTR